LRFAAGAFGLPPFFASLAKTHKCLIIGGREGLQPIKEILLKNAQLKFIG
jgi:hypothetical protein